MSQTIQTELIKVTCSKLGEKTPMQCSKCCPAKVSYVQPPWSKLFHDSKCNPGKRLLIARNLSKFSRKVVKVALTDAVPNAFLSILNKIPNC